MDIKDWGEKSGEKCRVKIEIWDKNRKEKAVDSTWVCRTRNTSSYHIWNGN